jgi:polyphosphate kinase
MDEKKESATGKGSRIPEPYMQNRELSWLTFNERVLDQGADPNVPLIERMQFVSIFWSNLQEFFMVRVGSLTDLQLLKKEVLDSKTLMTPSEQLDAIHKRCHELYPLQEAIYHDVRNQLAQHGIKELDIRDLNADQLDYLRDYLNMNVVPFLSPQIINSRHPFPHLENGGLYVVVRLDGEIGSKTSMTKAERKAAKAERKKMRELGAEGVTLGLIPMPRQAEQVIKLPWRRPSASSCWSTRSR